MLKSGIKLTNALEVTAESTKNRMYREALRMRKNEPEVSIGIAELLKRHGKVQESLKSLEDTIAADPNNPFYHMKLAETLREMARQAAESGASVALNQLQSSA